MSAASCLLSVVWCLLPAVCCLLAAVRCLLSDVYGPLATVYCLVEGVILDASKYEHTVPCKRENAQLCVSPDYFS
jgi:hypothetical protein